MVSRITACAPVNSLAPAPKPQLRDQWFSNTPVASAANQFIDDSKIEEADSPHVMQVGAQSPMRGVTLDLSRPSKPVDTDVIQHHLFDQANAFAELWHRPVGFYPLTKR